MPEGWGGRARDQWGVGSLSVEAGVRVSWGEEGWGSELASVVRVWSVLLGL